MHFSYFNTIRFIACLIVIAVHTEILKHYRFQEVSTILKFSYEIGKMAVSVFFVLSGFLIGSLLLHEQAVKGKINLKLFFKKRALKILPLYFLLVFAAFIVVPFFDFTYIPRQTEDLQENFFSKLICFVLLLPQLNATLYHFVPGAEQLWTIGSEVIAYSVLPFVVMRMQKNAYLPIKIIFGIMVLKVILKFINGFGIDIEAIMKFVFYNKVDCVLAGCMAAYWHRNRNKYWVNLTSHKSFFLLSFTLSALLIIIETLTEFTDSYLSHSILFLIPIGYLCNKEIKQKTFFSITEILGNYTYSIYIWSYMVLFVIYKLTQIIFKLENITTANANLFLFANTLWISVLVGFISYYTIEKPFLKLKER